MTVNITDVDTFTDPIVAPATGEPITEASDKSPVQGLANRTLNLKNRVDGLAIAARYSVSGTSQYSAQEATLTEDFDNLTSFTLAANLITVPSVGVYQISLRWVMANSLVNNPQPIEMGVLSNSTVSWGGGLTIETRAYAARFSATAADSVGAGVTGLVEITDTAAQKLFVSTIGSGVNTISSTSSLSISKVPS